MRAIGDTAVRRRIISTSCLALLALGALTLWDTAAARFDSPPSILSVSRVDNPPGGLGAFGEVQPEADDGLIASQRAQIERRIAEYSAAKKDSALPPHINGTSDLSVPLSYPFFPQAGNQY